VEKIPFCEIKDFHVEILRSIERGQKSWSDSFSEEQARTLVSTFGWVLTLPHTLSTHVKVSYRRQIQNGLLPMYNFQLDKHRKWDFQKVCL
jgi:hypothetical protein